MSRTAALFTAGVVSFALIGVALIVERTWLVGLACLALGLTALVFSRELSEQEPIVGRHDLLQPKTRAGRQTMLTVCGALLALGGAVVAVSALI